jgi:ribonuclease HII
MELAGVEEAGRGPVIGPMVMASVVIESDEEENLKSLGIKDSKLLLPKRREELFDIITKKVKRYHIIILSAKEVDDSLNDPVMNLNLLEAKTSARLIDILKPEKVILDCPSNNPPAYILQVQRFLERKGVSIIAEHKADLNYPVVSAASILAKVTRDRIIEDIKKEIGIDFGSGYPSDPKTVAFLKKYYDRYDLFRKTWSSYRRIIESKKQANLKDF